MTVTVKMDTHTTLAFTIVCLKKHFAPHSQPNILFYKFLMILLSVTKGLTLSTLTLHRCTWARIGTSCTCCSCSPLAGASTSRPLPVRLPLSPFPGPHPRYTADSRFRGFPAQNICQENTTFSDFL